MVVASYMHISRIAVIDLEEIVSLIGDILIVTVVIIYFISKLMKMTKKIKKPNTET